MVVRVRNELIKHYLQRSEESEETSDIEACNAIPLAMRTPELIYNEGTGIFNLIHL